MRNLDSTTSCHPPHTHTHPSHAAPSFLPGCCNASFLASFRPILHSPPATRGSVKLRDSCFFLSHFPMVSYHVWNQTQIPFMLPLPNQALVQPFSPLSSQVQSLCLPQGLCTGQVHSSPTSSHGWPLLFVSYRFFVS